MIDTLAGFGAMVLAGLGGLAVLCLSWALFIKWVAIESQSQEEEDPNSSHCKDLEWLWSEPEDKED